jgi:hypothetical protein
MAGWKNPGRAQRVVIHLEGGGAQQYWRCEDGGGNVVWSQNAPRPGEGPSGDAMTTAELVKVIEASVRERRRAARGLKFRL